MKLGLRHLAAHLTILLALGAAQAQDDLLQRYERAVESLRVSVEVLPTDVALARDELLLAEGALRTLPEEAVSLTLVGQLERVFERAAAAIDNRSQTDLAVQTSVIAGGFRRFVLEAALQDAASGRFERARNRMVTLAEDMRLPGRDALAAASDGATLQRVFEGGVAERAAIEVERAAALLADSRDAAYRALAGAYGDLLTVQDSPRASARLSQDFVTAVQALVDGEDETFLATAERLRQGLERFAAAARAPESAEAPAAAAETAPAAPAAAEPTAPAETEPTAAAETAEAAPEAPAQEAPAETAPAQAATAQVAPRDPAPAPETSAEAPAEPRPGDATAAAAPAETGPGDAIERARAEIRAFGGSAGVAAVLADRIVQDDAGSLREVLNDLLVTSGRTVAATEIGDLTSARQGVREFGADYLRYLSPLVLERDPGFDADTRSLVASLQRAPALRLQDTVVLLGHATAVETLLAGGTPPATHDAIVQTTVVWAGVVRLIALVLFGLLAFVPLYLLNLAFGGGNRNWQLVGVSLFLLLLPIIYEAIGSIGLLLAEWTGVRALAVPASFSIFQNTISQVVWVLVTAIAIGFAIAGLYGICVQFGLLGRRLPGGAAATSGAASDSSARVTASEVGEETLVDWDEEF